MYLLTQHFEKTTGGLSRSDRRPHTHTLTKCCKYSDILSTPFLYASLPLYTLHSISLFRSVVWFFIMHVINQPSLSVGSAQTHTQTQHTKKFLCERKKRTRTRIPLFSPPFTQTHTRNFLRPTCEEENSAHVSERKSNTSLFLPASTNTLACKKKTLTHSHTQKLHTALVLDDSCLGLW